VGQIAPGRVLFPTIKKLQVSEAGEERTCFLWGTGPDQPSSCRAVSWPRGTAVAAGTTSPPQDRFLAGSWTPQKASSRPTGGQHSFGLKLLRPSEHHLV